MRVNSRRGKYNTRAYRASNTHRFLQTRRGSRKTAGLCAERGRCSAPLVPRSPEPSPSSETTRSVGLSPQHEPCSLARQPRRVQSLLEQRRNLWKIAVIACLVWQYTRCQQTTKGCILWRISRREVSSWWTTATIQRCCQTKPNGYKCHRRPLGDACTRSTTVEAGHSQRKKPYWRIYISQKYQHDHNLRHGFPDASAPIIFYVNCGRGVSTEIGLIPPMNKAHGWYLTLMTSLGTMDSSEKDFAKPSTLLPATLACSLTFTAAPSSPISPAVQPN